jgi:AraC-like DNA-binding protein
MFNGRALYRAARAWFAVTEQGYLILNEREPYEIHIDSPTLVESFIVFFPTGWAEQGRDVLTLAPHQLLERPETMSGAPSFFERFTPNDRWVSPLLATLRRAHQNGPLSDMWVEEQLRELLARMWQAQEHELRRSDTLPSLRPATRNELWRRLHRARDYIHAHSDSALTVTQIARVASLSPYHFMRAFKSLFRTTAHAYLSGCRVERAKFLLERTGMPVTEICLTVGFESLGSFSSWFRRSTGEPPLAWRRRNSRIEEVLGSGSR